MREYFEEMMKIEETLERMSKLESLHEKEVLLEELIKYECFRQHTNYQYGQDITTEFVNGKIQEDNCHELKKNFFMSRGLSNFPDEGDREKRKTRYHTHNYIEIIYVYEGQYSHYINGIKYQHYKGELCILNTNVLHCDEIIGKDDLVIFLCLKIDYLRKSIDREEPCFNKLKSFLKNTEDKKIREYLFLNHKRDLIRLLIERIAKEQHEKLSGYSKVIGGCIERLMYLIFRYYKVELISEQSENIEQRIFSEIDQMIRKNLENITRTELGDHFYYTPDHINRIIKQNTGQSYVDYTKKLKLEYARNELLESNKSINNIINELGYNNKTYFYKMFKKEYGITPKEYRENYKNSIMIDR